MDIGPPTHHGRVQHHCRYWVVCIRVYGGQVSRFPWLHSFLWIVVLLRAPTSELTIVGMII